MDYVKPQRVQVFSITELENKTGARIGVLKNNKVLTSWKKAFRQRFGCMEFYRLLEILSVDFYILGKEFTSTVLS